MTPFCSHGPRPTCKPSILSTTWKIPQSCFLRMLTWFMNFQRFSRRQIITLQCKLLPWKYNLLLFHLLPCNCLLLPWKLPLPWKLLPCNPLLPWKLQQCNLQLLPRSNLQLSSDSSERYFVIPSLVFSPITAIHRTLDAWREWDVCFLCLFAEVISSFTRHEITWQYPHRVLLSCVSRFFLSVRIAAAR